MDILAALKREERRCEKQAEEARQQLETVREAMKLFRRRITGRKKRLMSAAARAKISKATKERWAKYRAQKA